MGVALVAVTLSLLAHTAACRSDARGSTGPEGGRIDGAAACQMVEEGALLLDVRTVGEFSQGHIDGAVNIPVQELRDRIDAVGDSEQTVVVYCRSGSRSAIARDMLREAGFRDVYDLGTMSAWTCD
jgi:phage shock protein E